MLTNLMTKRADWYRPTPAVDTTNTEWLSTDVRLGCDIPCSIQPMTAKEITFYSAYRSMEVSHSIYTTFAGPWQRNDVLVYKSRRFTVVGVRDLIELGRVFVLDVMEFDEANPRQ